VFSRTVSIRDSHRLVIDYIGDTLLEYEIVCGCPAFGTAAHSLTVLAKLASISSATMRTLGIGLTAFLSAALTPGCCFTSMTPDVGLFHLLIVEETILRSQDVLENIWVFIASSRLPPRMHLRSAD
jgi:hypothetical protein